MAEKIGSQLESATTAPPLEGSAQPGQTDDYAAILDLLKKKQAGQETGESGRVITSENAFELQPVPGYPTLSAAAYQRQFLGMRPAQVARLQRALVAAGYLKKDDIASVGDAFDHATRQALSWLTEDSVYSGYRPRDILGYRIKIKSGQKPGQMQLADETSPEDHRREMSDAYHEVWRRPPPPHYLDQFQNMNPDEFASYERAKVTWETSGVAEDERKELASLLAKHMNQPRQGQAATTGRGLKQTYSPTGEKLATPQVVQ